MGRHLPVYEKKYTSICKHCSCEFKHIRANALYCSIRCKDNFHYLTNRKKPTMTSNCIICDKEFTHVRNEAVTCSPVCNAKKQFNKKKLDRLNI